MDRRYSKFLHRTLPLSIGTVLLALTGLTGCDRPEPVTYQIPKEDRTPRGMGDARATAPTPPATAASGEMKGPDMQVLPGMAEAAAEAGEITYTVPEGWEERPASGVRKATLIAPGERGNAELAVTVFPGDVGGNLANVNRWRQQLGMAPVTADRLPELTEPYVISAHRGLFVRLVGPEEAVLGGLLPFHGSTWFFKMQGPIATVIEQEAAMKAFLDSVEIEDHYH